MKILKQYRAWEMKHWPKTTKWWDSLHPVERAIYRAIAIITLYEAIRL